MRVNAMFYTLVKALGLVLLPAVLILLAALP